MKIATWNVNGIRARDAQLQEFIEREQPDVLCLQEIKASLEQLPVWLCQLEGYWCYWHGGKGYSGVALHVRKDAFPAAAGLSASAIRLRTPHRHRRAARIYDRVDLRAERRQGLPGQDAIPGVARAVRGRVRGVGAAAGAVRRFQRRANRHGRPSRRSESRTSSVSGRTSGRSSSASSATGSSTCIARWSRRTPSFSRGGRHGETCGSATSAGASTWCSRAARSPTGRFRASSSASSARAITGRSWPCSGLRKTMSISLSFVRRAGRG